MRFLLISNNCISDPTAGVAHSMRTICRWLIEAGHECRVLTSARFEAPVTFTIEEHLDSLGVRVPKPALQSAKQKKSRSRSSKKKKKSDTSPPKRAVVQYEVDGVPVVLLLTRHNDESKPDRAEARQYLKLFDTIVHNYKPHQVIGINAHPMIRWGFERARQLGITTVFTVRGYGYEKHPSFFQHIDHVFTCSQLITDVLQQEAGVSSTPLGCPIDRSDVFAPTESRTFVTFVNPSPHKGVFLFARLADMLGSRRPDIPMMVVQSGHSAMAMNQIPEFDFTKYPQLMASPPVPKPSDYLALTKLLLVPSVWKEPFGRVAVEAMINRIPPLVSDRGFLPNVIGGDYSEGGGGRVLPVPDWMDGKSQRVPSEEEAQPWFNAVSELWDDSDLYESVAERGAQIADELYSEPLQREQHVNWLTSRRPHTPAVDELLPPSMQDSVEPGQ